MNHAGKHLRIRARDEAHFHDARVEDRQGRRLAFAYACVADVYRFGELSPAEHAGRSVLEIGCFLGEQACRARSFHGRYVGIDISRAAIEHCRGLGLPSRFEFRVDDANVLHAVEDGSVDYAFGHGVLHHLHLPSFTAALARKLAPGGCARFVEPARGNLLLRAFRRLTPRLRTEDEAPFGPESLAELRRGFEVQVTYHALLRPWLPMLFFNSPAVSRAARSIDNLLLKHRWAQEQAWLLQIELRRAKAAKCDKFMTAGRQISTTTTSVTHVS